MVIAAFAMGAGEFIVAGVIKDIAADLQVTLGAVGWFESAYAIGVAIGARSSRSSARVPSGAACS